MSNKFSGVLALVVFSGLALAPVIASANTFVISSPGLNFSSL